MSEIYQELVHPQKVCTSPTLQVLYIDIRFILGAHTFHAMTVEL